MDGKTKTAAGILVVCLVLCTSIITSGDAAAAAAAGGGCPPSSIVVTQYGTGEWAHGQPVYAATVRNTCGCAQSNVKLATSGFDSTLAVDPAKLKALGGGVFLVDGGAPVAQGQGVTFRYAWAEQFVFRPVSSTVAC